MRSQKIEVAKIILSVLGFVFVLADTLIINVIGLSMILIAVILEAKKL